MEVGGGELAVLSMNEKELWDLAPHRLLMNSVSRMNTDCLATGMFQTVWTQELGNGVDSIQLKAFGGFV